MAEDECKFPSTWTDNKIARIDWLQGFMKKKEPYALQARKYKSVQGHCVQYNKHNGIFQQLRTHT